MVMRQPELRFLQLDMRVRPAPIYASKYPPGTTSLPGGLIPPKLSEIDYTGVSGIWAYREPGWPGVGHPGGRPQQHQSAKMRR